jgi:antibiotic biosynthesis monooxygenase (ABM) superfamily enzyme
MCGMSPCRKRVLKDLAMSLVDKFENQSEPGFTRNFDAESARRQLRVSVVLVVAMGLAAFVLGFALPLAPHATKSSPLANHNGFTGRLVSISDR